MRTARWLTSLSKVICLGFLASPSCDRHPALVFPSTTQLPSSEPPPAALDLASPPPPALPHALSDESVFTLQTPLGEPSARRTVKEFFDAVLGEHITALAATMRRDASTHDLRPRAKRRKQHALNVWRQRFRKREYQRLRDQPLYRSADIMTYRSDRVAALPAAILQAVGREKLNDGDLVLRVPLSTHTVDNERFLSEEMTFWLAPANKRFLIYAIAEAYPF